MRIVVALDVHRRQITYKTLDRESGEVRRGRIVPATRGAVREWLERFAGRQAAFVLEGTTGWRFVVEKKEHFDNKTIYNLIEERDDVRHLHPGQPPWRPHGGRGHRGL